MWCLGELDFIIHVMNIRAKKKWHLVAQLVEEFFRLVLRNLEFVAQNVQLPLRLKQMTNAFSLHCIVICGFQRKQK